MRLFRKDLQRNVLHPIQMPSFTKEFERMFISFSEIIVTRDTVRVKGGKSLRNGMWNGVRNGIIMRNTIYAGNKLTEERILFSRQFYKSSSFFDVADY